MALIRGTAIAMAISLALLVVVAGIEAPKVVPAVSQNSWLTPTASAHKPAPSPAEDENFKKKVAGAMQAMIVGAGYDCTTVDDVVPNAWTYVTSHESYTVACNHYRYLFTVENHGGRWSVKSS